VKCQHLLILFHIALVNDNCAFLTCPRDKNLSRGQNYFVLMCVGQNSFVPAVYILCASRNRTTTVLADTYGFFFD
jgi:hypothetical protein